MAFQRRLLESRFEAFLQNDGSPLSLYHDLSSRPITSQGEDDMELLSSLATSGDDSSEEKLLSEWRPGVYTVS